MVGFTRPPSDAGIIHATPAFPAALSEKRKRLTRAATILGSSMAFIDGSVVNIALPAIQQALHADAASTQWIVNAYLLLLGALVLVGGSAADLYGRRRIFLLGIAIFTTASIACGLAPDITVLVVSRAVQGLGAALLIPASLAMLGATFDEHERSHAIGIWAGVGALTAAAGPVLGGWLVDQVSWHAIFLLNVPLAIAAAGLAVFFACESRDEKAKPLDWKGGRHRPCRNHLGIGRHSGVGISGQSRARRAGRGNSVPDIVRRDRGPLPRTGDDAAVAVPITQFFRNQHRDAAALLRPRRRDVFSPLRPDPARRLFRDTGRRGVAAVRIDHGVRSIVRGCRLRPFRAAAVADHRAHHRCLRIGTARLCRPRKILLGRRVSSDRRACDRRDHHRATVDIDGDGIEIGRASCRERV